MELVAITIALWAATVTSGWVMVASCLFGWLLLLLAAIDWRSFRLPTPLTILLGAAGVAASFPGGGAAVLAHTLGTVIGFVAFSGVAWTYRKWRRREGLGGGDAKLLAGIGAWVTAPGLPTVVLFAAVLALAFVGLRAIRGGHLHATEPIPFGPFLATGAWLVWLYGPLLLDWPLAG